MVTILMKVKHHLPIAFSILLFESANFLTDLQLHHQLESIALKHISIVAENLVLKLSIS